MSDRRTVHRNLAIPGCVYSVLNAGKVERRTTAILLSAARMKHATAKQRAICQTRRRVCQWISGVPVEMSEAPRDGWRSLNCCPKRFNGIQDSETGERIDSASYVLLTDCGVWFSNSICGE